MAAHPYRRRLEDQRADLLGHCSDATGEESMRKSVLGLIALVAATVISSADGAEASDATMSDAQREVLRVEREWSDAEIKHDVAALRLILDDRFIATFG